MSMTKEEAIKILKHLAEIISSGDYQETFKMAISAMRPITREQVEKAWKGKWEGVPRLGVYDMACSKCGFCPGIRFYSSDFCPNCGAPMTDEAVDIVLERLEEALKDGN